MSFMNKVKNFFYEDVEDDEEVVVKEKKEKPKRENKIDFKSFLKRDEKDDVEEYEIEETREINVKQKTNNDLSERELFKSERTFNFPMDMGDEIFDEEDEPTIIKDEPKIKERKTEPVRPIQRTNPNTSSIYRNISTEEPKKEEPKHFRPSPIISPVYGILDKNYTVDDVVEKDLNKTKEFSIEKKSVDFDTVRNRAYKELDDEIEKTLTGDIFYNLDSEEGSIPEEDNSDDFEDDNNDSVIITYDDEEKEALDEIQVPVEEEPTIEPEIESKIDPIPEEFEEPSENEEDDLVPDVTIEPKKETKKTRKKKEEPKEEKEDLFNLIDNMYNEEDEEEDE